MSKILGGSVESEGVVKTETTLVRRMSNMLKDGNSSPPMLFRHTSMQKIRHCCQNLNLFPYLLYSFDNSKSHPFARKMHVCFGEFLKGITTHALFLYKNLRQCVLREISVEKKIIPRPLPTVVKEKDEHDSVEKPATKFRKTGREKRKQIPLLLTLAVYLAPLLLAFQLIGLVSLMIIGKYAPGFIFLTTALLFLGCISLRVMFHETMVHRIKCERSKVQ